jgi:DNA invertase Pin-like site-specific DNA recombinase
MTEQKKKSTIDAFNAKMKANRNVKNEAPKSKKQLKLDAFNAKMKLAVDMYEDGKTIEEIARKMGHHVVVIQQALLGAFGKPSERYKWTKHATSEEDVKLILKMKEEGKTLEEIAKELKISKTSVHRKSNKPVSKKGKAKKKFFNN